VTDMYTEDQIFLLCIQEFKFRISIVISEQLLHISLKFVEKHTI